RTAGMNPYFLVGETFEAFVNVQVGEFEAMSREIGLIK
ncbi:MAG: tripartite tricarboxylate transporter substrate binding protein, partial [Gemmatimonadales bacterium]|nr:tripartite tricarboxylate transporter substrate binding protein [Gemmatimonadales bacterium]